MRRSRHGIFSGLALCASTEAHSKRRRPICCARLNSTITATQCCSATSRAGETAAAELEANAGRLKDKKWPYAVIELYLGKRSPEATLDAAGKPDEKCEAQFYIGQWHILKGDRSAAAAPLKAAVETCPKTFIEYVGAVVELKRLKL